MKPNKSKTAALIFALILILSLAACGGNNPGGVSQAEYDRLQRDFDRLQDEFDSVSGSESISGGVSQAEYDRLQREFDRLQDELDSINGNHPSGSSSYASAQKGDIIQFGGYGWRVLEVKDGKALVLSENVLETRAYYEQDADITWEESDMRQYLNGAFYDNTFSASEKNKIIESDVANVDSNTKDKIFLLSNGEANQYFDNTSARIGYTAGGAASWWWLRSPGRRNYLTASVLVNGSVFADGITALVDSGGVRPALWLKL